jgi:hypothetical protein
MCSLEEMRSHGELGWLFKHTIPSKPVASPSEAMINMPVEEVLPVLAVLAASVTVSFLFLTVEHLAVKRSLARPGVLAQGGRRHKLIIVEATRPPPSVSNRLQYKDL